MSGDASVIWAIKKDDTWHLSLFEDGVFWDDGTLIGAISSLDQTIGSLNVFLVDGGDGSKITIVTNETFDNVKAYMDANFGLNLSNESGDEGIGAYSFSSPNYTFNMPDGWSVADNSATTTWVNPPTLTYGYAGVGLFLGSSDSNILSNNTLSGNGNGLVFAGDSDSNTDTQSAISSLGNDITSFSSGVNTLFNVTYTTTYITDGQINVYYDIRARVRDSLLNPLAGAVCSAVDANGNSFSLGTTNSSGYTGYISVNAFNLNASGYQTNNNDFTVSAAKTNYQTNSTTATINQPNQTISLILSPPPANGPPVGFFVNNNQNNQNQQNNNNNNNQNNNNQNNQNNQNNNNNNTGRRPDNTLIRYQGDPKVYLIKNQQKCWIPDVQTFNQLGFNWNEIVIVPDTETYPDGANIAAQNTGGQNPITYQFTKLLKQGQRNAEVKLLQQKLQQLGFFPKNISPTDFFGLVTKQALKAFQRANGISPVGYLGPKTRELLNEK